MGKYVLLAILVLAAGLLAAAALGRFRWAGYTRTLRARLKAARQTAVVPGLERLEMEALPPPVQRYLQKAVKKGAPLIAEARIRHQGTFNMSEAGDRWKPFCSDQQVIIQPPGFDWDASVNLLPGVCVRVHDAYAAGEGLTYAALLGLLPVANLRGAQEVAAGQLMRFLAEAAWYPTALLPGQGVVWTAIDARSAHAAMTDGSVTVTLRFRFDDQGLIEAVEADARSRTVGGRIVPTPWQARVWDYREHAEMLMPRQGEVAWLLPGGAKPYWRARITSMEYLFAKHG
ncbi:MAG: hypothetical protein IT159_12170 [Bryobacterales bacterium]|nr:hypothetical protein [Bryobacterales bacterium]